MCDIITIEAGSSVRIPTHTMLDAMGIDLDGKMDACTERADGGWGLKGESKSPYSLPKTLTFLIQKP